MLYAEAGTEFNIPAGSTLSSLIQAAYRDTETIFVIRYTKQCPNSAKLETALKNNNIIPKNYLTI